MKRFLFLPLLFACGGQDPIEFEEQPRDCTDAREPLAIQTWNVEQFPRADQANLVADIIRQLSADLIGLQEIRHPEKLWDLVDDLPDYEGLLAAPGYYTQVAVLYRPDKLEVLSSRSLFIDDSYAFPRPPLEVKLRIRGTNQQLRVVVVHLKAQIDSESEARRRTAIERMHQWASELADEPLMILGDFNDKLTDSNENNVFERFLGDPDFDFLTLPLEQSGEFSYITYRAMIDHMLVSSATLELMREETTEVLHLDESWIGYEEKVSDHRPVQSMLCVQLER